MLFNFLIIILNVVSERPLIRVLLFKSTSNNSQSVTPANTLEGTGPGVQ